MLATSTAFTTARSSTSHMSAIFRLLESDTGRSLRSTSASGCIPMERRAATECCVVYAMVNTLCALSSVNAVRFYVEGVAADTLAGSIYLRSPLMPNPGIVVTPAVTSEP